MPDTGGMATNAQKDIGRAADTDNPEQKEPRAAMGDEMRPVDSQRAVLSRAPTASFPGVRCRLGHRLFHG
jgi:hypothetical protein